MTSFIFRFVFISFILEFFIFVLLFVITIPKNVNESKIIDGKLIIHKSFLFGNLVISTIFINVVFLALNALPKDLFWLEIIIILAGLFIILFKLLNILYVLKGNYFIVEDILENTSSNTDLINRNYAYYLLFKTIFNNYGKYVRVNFFEYKDAILGEKYYIVYVKNKECVFKKSKFLLKEKNKVVSFDFLEQKGYLRKRR